jgi:hypothetical protein
LIGARSKSALVSIFVALRTTASVPAFASANRLSKLRCSVCPSTSVPERNDTPRNTARKAPMRRLFRTQALLRTMRFITAPSRRRAP